MKLKETVGDRAWRARPTRRRTWLRGVRTVVQAVAATTPDEWVVVELNDQDQRRLQTIRSQIMRAAALEGITVRLEGRGGDLGVTRA